MSELNRIQRLRFPNGRGRPPVMSQQELAVRLTDLTGEKWDQSRVSRVESNPDDAPTKSVVAMLKVLGAEDPMAVLTDGDEFGDGVDAGDSLAGLHRDLGVLRDYAESYMPPDGRGGGELEQQLAKLVPLCDQLGEKPRLAMFGKFDAGKSTIVNRLLGAQRLPTSYAPATRVVTYVHHIEDRPEWLPETVLLLDSSFDPEQWTSEEHCREHKVVAGGLETLREHGTHRGAAGKDSPASFALVFLDAHILRSCTVVDLPGTENDTLDTRKATAAEVAFDAAVFADTCTGFMSEGSLTRLAEVVRRLPIMEVDNLGVTPLANLFVVATHAHGGISDMQLRDEVLDSGVARTWRHLGETILADRAASTGRRIERDDLKKRFFTFDSQIASRRAPLLGDIEVYLETQQPLACYRKADDAIQAFCLTAGSQTQQAMQFYTAAIEDRSAAARQLADLLDAEDQRLTTARYARQAVQATIARQRAEMDGYLRSVVWGGTDPDAIEELLRAMFDDKKDAQQNAAGLVLERIDHEVKQNLNVRTRSVNALIEEFIGEYDKATMPRPDQPDAVHAPFNAKGAFAGGFVGLAAVGGLALWASTLGNLGAYILVAQAVSAVSAVGISTGGTAAWISAVSTIGGPVTIAIGIVAIAAILGFALLRGPWQKVLAKKISAALRDSGIQEMYLDNVANYWRDTANAFDAGADNIEREWQTHLEQLRAIVDENDVTVLQQRLVELGQIADFLQGLPWGGPPRLALQGPSS